MLLPFSFWLHPGGPGPWPDGLVMSSPLLPIIVRHVRDRGPITVAEYVRLALYHPEHGYYSSAAQRSGRAGDFFTSVDLGPMFGELLCSQLAEMWRGSATRTTGPATFDLVEAAAGNGRLARDILDAASKEAPDFLAAVRLHLVEASAPARDAQPQVLGPHASRLVSSSPSLPARIEGVVLANELLDALPPHLVVMREAGLREVFVSESRGRLVTVEGPPSTVRLAQYLASVSATLEPGWFAEINLAASDWVREAARRLVRGFMLLIDYGHEAGVLYSGAHAAGTLASFRLHASESRDLGPGWLSEPGLRDLTSHVDLTGVRLAAEGEGLTTLGLADQTYFLLGLGLEERLSRETGDPAAMLRRRLALKTLLLPGGLGSSHKVMVFARGVGTPALKGLTAGRRLT